MPEKRVTMQQVADACGVSKVTVSLALRGKKNRMMEATYDKVLKVAKEMGYTHDPQLSKLSTYLVNQKRGKSIKGELAYLVVLHKDAPKTAVNLYFYKIMKPIAESYGYRIEIYKLGEHIDQGMSVAQIERIWDTRGVRGVFVAPVWIMKPPVMSWDKYSWISFGESLRTPSLHRIDSDFRLAAIECFKQLHELGYRRVGMIVLMGYDRSLQYAIRSAYDAYHVMYPRAQRLKLLDEDLPPDFEIKSEGFRRWIESEKPDAIIGDSATYRVLLEMGYKIPEDFGFASWHLEGDNPLKLSGVMRGEETLAKTSVELMLSQVDHGVVGVPSSPIRTRVTGHWVDGATTRTCLGT